MTAKRGTYTQAKLQGERIQQLRKMTHLSRRAFAAKHGLSAGSLQNCENGRYQGLTKKTAYKLVHAFQSEGINCTLDWLINGNDNLPGLSLTVHHRQLLSLAVQQEQIHQLNIKFFSALAQGRYHQVVSLIEDYQLDLRRYEGSYIKPYDNNHNSPLHLAALNGYEEILKFLIKKNANINSKNRNNETALHLSILCGYENIFTLLVNANADLKIVDNDGDSFLAWAVYKGHLNIMKKLIQLNLNVNAENKWGHTPLHWAAHQGFVELAKLLISSGADINIKNHEGQAPIETAAIRGQVEMVRFLAGIQK